MKTFRSLVVLKRPRHELWTVMRDHLVEFSGQIADIEEIRQIERRIDTDGVVHIVNEWRVRQQVPAMVWSIGPTYSLSISCGANSVNRLAPAATHAKLSTVS